MNTKDLEIFNKMPFFFWVKDDEGKYIWANNALVELANGEIVGKTDRELPWSENADTLKAADRRVLETGKTQFIHEYVDEPGKGKITLNVCKFAEELDGNKCAFGISVID
jgi:PAS domain-containing protein